MTRYILYSITIQIISLLSIHLVQSIQEGRSFFQLNVQAKTIEKRKKQEMISVPYRFIPKPQNEGIGPVVTKLEKQQKSKSTGDDRRTEIIRSKISRMLLDIGYPPIARRMGMQGRVLIRILIQEDGRLKDVTLIRSSGYRLLDRAALDGVSRWSFDPGSREEILVPVVFRLE